MALAAIGYAKAKRRRQIMVAASLDRAGRDEHGDGGGRSRMRTACRCCSSRATPSPTALPDPVLQQVEHFGNPTITVNDAFKAVTPLLGPDHAARADHRLAAAGGRRRCWTRPTAARPSSRSARTPRRSPSTTRRPSSSPAVWTIPRPRPDRDRLAEAVELLQDREEAADHLRRRRALLRWPRRPWRSSRGKRGIPVGETIAGKGAVTHDHPAHAGPIGIIGSTSANALAAEADVILAIGTRLQDFTTGSWTVFGHDARFVAHQRRALGRDEAPRARRRRRRPRER